MNTKVDESKLISGKEALIALANGEDVECRAYEHNWINVDNKHHHLSLFFDDSFQFRIKPRTIKLSLEIPAPFEPNHGDMVWCLNELSEKGYEARTAYDAEDFVPHIAYWRTEEEIKQFVAALRQVFGASHD